MRIEELADVATATLATTSRGREQQHQACYADLPIKLLLEGRRARSQIHHTRRRLDGSASGRQQDGDQERRRRRLESHAWHLSHARTRTTRRTGVVVATIPANIPIKPAAPASTQPSEPVKAATKAAAIMKRV